MVELTDQQRKALRLDKHISVTANAGSGKTRVLVERYVAAVRSGVRVEQILCLTFTEKAALELRQKISERIGSDYREARRVNAEYASALAEARRNMLEANISTIHAFCSQVLREFPVEAGIDANFKVLEDFDAASLKEDSCMEAVRSSLAEERPATVNRGTRPVHDLLVKVGYAKVLSLLIDLLDNREKIEHARITGKDIVPDESVLRRHWFNMANAVADVIRLNVSAKKGELSVEALTESMADPAGPTAPLLMELKSILSKVLTKAGTPRKRDVVLEAGARYSYDEALTILQTPYLALRDVPDESIGGDAEGYLRIVKTLAGLYEKSESNYSRKKYLMAALDFDDLQILTLRLLSGKEDVRQTLVSRFRHVMVDEFQDTNFLQYGIFLRLLNNLGSDSRLFVVGDPKQSIYRFRNAQVEVSQTAGDRLASLDNGLSLPLSESFRMNSDIARFVNNIFPSVLRGNKVFGMAGIPSMNQADYNSLVPRRPNGTLNAIEIFMKEKGNNRPDGTEEGNDGDDEVSPSEEQAAFVAARIREMLDAGEKIRRVRDGEKEGKITYADIAILLRTRSKLPLLEDALTRYGVPFVVSAGTGFYSSQEIYDLTGYLTFLLDNTADVALLTVLRSPLFGISENELYAMSLLKGDSLYERLHAFAESATAGDEVRYAASVLEEEIQVAQRQTIPQLINRILERTGWLGAYRLSQTADQRVANLRKLLGIAREFEGRGFNSLFDFVERIKYLKETAREGQAPVEEAADAVKIMTVHAAKGLEFPVVFIPFCDAGTRRDAGTIINDDIGILPFVGDEVPAMFSIYKRFEILNEQAEIARLFYVACTRAMDKLVITTTNKKSAKSMNSFTDILAKSLDLSAIPDEGFFELSGEKIRVHAGLPQVTPKAAEKALKAVEIGDILLNRIPADIDGEMYSATLLQTFRLCPTKYFLRYRLGMSPPESGIESAGSGDRLEDYDDTILSTVKGQLVHSVLEQVLGKGSTDPESVRKAAKHVISSGVEGSLSAQKSAELLKVVEENARNAIVTLEKIGITGRKYVEQTVTRRFMSDFLTGTLDLLIEDGRGYHIYDYKTNRLEKSQEEIYSGYEIQMKLYASLCSNLKPSQEEFDVTIIFTREPDRYLRKIYTRSDLSDFEEDISSMLEKIKSTERGNGEFPSSDSLPTESPHCVECEYFVGESARKACLMKMK